ncbi:hypothetical protein LSAT2_003218 [Lamellibrachia satsuma]|nr:hypothetical protein LSAT2_003218 [Lamellibrachia satsuma]
MVRTGREDGGSIPPPPFRSLDNFVHPTLSVSFGRDSKSRWSLLPDVYARGTVAHRKLTRSLHSGCGSGTFRLVRPAALAARSSDRPLNSWRLGAMGGRS